MFIASFLNPTRWGRCFRCHKTDNNSNCLDQPLGTFRYLDLWDTRVKMHTNRHDFTHKSEFRVVYLRPNKVLAGIIGAFVQNDYSCVESGVEKVVFKMVEI